MRTFLILKLNTNSLIVLYRTQKAARCFLETLDHTSRMNFRSEGTIMLFVSLPFLEDFSVTFDDGSKQNDTISIMHGLAWAVGICRYAVCANHKSLPH